MTAASPRTRYEGLAPLPPDPIFGLKAAYDADDRAEKLDLSAGVYKDDSGRTPVFAAVREAQQRLIEQESTKAYLPILGAAGFREAIAGLLELPDAAAVAQTPSGTAALALAARLTGSCGARRVFLPDPTWANHAPIMERAGLEVVPYRYGPAVPERIGRMLEDLAGATNDDLVLVHLCCHNPTGFDLDDEEWEALAEVVHARGLSVLVDAAYVGFAGTPADDVRPISRLAAAAPELYVATSCSKNFGLYRERVGALGIIIADGEQRARAAETASAIARAVWSNPPWLGGTIVAEVLGDTALRASWSVELTEMRDRLHEHRRTLAERTAAAGVRALEGISDGNGMFHVASITPEQADELRSKHAVYLLRSGRFNIAALSAADIDTLCDALAAVGA
ncbi:MAG: aromatic amino acid transaminase [Acidimicrobiia bacterium]|nr:aromatic amino acid transaminase [Acidimicrobiia bacterium]